MADQYTRGTFKAVRGEVLAEKTYIMYPVVAGAMPVGVALPHDNNLAAGDWGVWTQILLAAAAPAVEYWYCGYKILATAADITDNHAVQIGSGLVADPPTVMHNDVDALAPLDAAAGAIDTVTFRAHPVPYPMYMPGATPISGQSAVTTKVATANITVGVLLATGF